MAFDAVVGPPGTGKSYFMVHTGLEKWALGYKKARERHHKLMKLGQVKPGDDLLRLMPPVDSYQGLAANFDFNLPALVHYLVVRHRIHQREAVVLAASVRVIENIQQLIDCWNVILLFDEAQLWFNARNFAYFPDEVLSFWTQHRKSGIYGILATQRYEMVDTNIRGVVANVYRAMPLPWTVRLARMIAARLAPGGGGPRRPGAPPIFRYSTMLDETEGRMSTARRGLGEALGKNRVVTLDPLVAACYATSGQFYTPSSELMDAAGSQKSKIRNALGLKYDLTKFRRNREGERPQYQPLTIQQLAECYLTGESVAALVREVQVNQYDQVVPRARFRAAAPLDGSAKRGRGATVSQALSKENPGALTPGAGQPPSEYSESPKGWGNRGIN